MSDETEQSFSSILDALFGEEQVPIHLLYRLSDLTADEMAEFKRRWPEIPAERRRVIIRHLADISEDDFVVDFSPIFAQCFRDSSAPVRVAALDGLWDATHVPLVRPIIEMMQHDESVEVRAAAAAALAHYVLMAEWGELPPAVSPPIVDALLAEYEKAETAIPIKRAALEALGAANHPRVDSLIEEAYESDDFGMQLSAVFAMGNSANNRWLPTIVDEMGNPVAAMRVEAARAAGAMGSSDAIDDLANLTVDEDLDVRLTAVTALGQIGGDAAQRILVDLADDPESEELHEAVDEALEELTWMTGNYELMSWDDDDSFLDDDEYTFGDELKN